jgi:aspartokinase/homoserine dehydrogenase 1
VRAIAQGCSEYNITVVVDQEDSVRALKAVHSRFYLSKTTMSVGVVGPGLIGSTLLEQFKDQVCNFLALFLLPIFGYVYESILILHSRSC